VDSFIDFNMEVATRTVVPTAMSMGGSQSVTVKYEHLADFPEPARVSLS
jgi:hypothetical protein